jgi:hypothetical protein
MDFALGVLNGFPHRFSRYIKRRGKSANECAAAAEVSLAELFEPPQTLRNVLVPAATDQLRRSQAKLFAPAGNEGLDGKLLVSHETSSFSMSRGGLLNLPSWLPLS